MCIFHADTQIYITQLLQFQNLFLYEYFLRSPSKMLRVTVTMTTIQCDYNDADMNVGNDD